MNRIYNVALTCVLAIAAPLAFCQTPGPAPGGPGGMGGRPHMEGRGHGMGIVPPGTWWRMPETIQALSLTADQQKRLDEIFLQSRTQLIQMHAALEQQQLELEPLLAANPVDDTRALTAISKIADARAELEKTDARMLLGLRNVLNPDQWTKLQAQQAARHQPGPDGKRQHRDFNGANPGGPPPPPPPPGGGGGEAND